MASAVARVSPGPLVLAAAVPFLFLHSRYQPDVGFTAGDTHVSVTLSDLAVLGVALAGLAAASSTGVAPLRRGVRVWAAAAAFLTLALVSLSYPLLRDEPYDWQARLVSALKLCEYAALALAVPLLVRRSADARWPLRALVAWSAAASVWGVLQFLGLVHEFEGKRPAQREPSFLGIHDFAALSGAALAIGLVALALRDDHLVGRAWMWLGLAAGGLGIVVSGAMTAVIGMWLAILGVAVVARRRRRLTRNAAAVAVAVGIAVTLGTAGMRGSALQDFAGFLGIARNETPGAVESYSQRTLLGYIGLRIWLDEPVTGVGYQGSNDEWAYGPQLAAAHRRFPDQPNDAFPSPRHPWGVQNLYLETLADLGVLGLAALALLLASALGVGIRGAASATLPLLGIAWLLVAVGVWAGLGIVPGIPLAALTWLALGLVTVRG
jgi:O-Antigen ligase